MNLSDEKMENIKNDIWWTFQTVSYKTILSVEDSLLQCSKLRVDCSGRTPNNIKKVSRCPTIKSWGAFGIPNPIPAYLTHNNDADSLLYSTELLV